MIGIKNSIEIERKYIIAMPNVSEMSVQAFYSVSEITQTYLSSPVGVTSRIRKRAYKDKTIYTQTKKIRIDKISAFEEEREITENEYALLEENIKPNTTPVVKYRHTFKYLGQLIEIDIYPQWTKTAIMETELDDKDKEVVMPTFIKIIREVSGISSYSNAAMSAAFPAEDKI